MHSSFLCLHIILSFMYICTSSVCGMLSCSPFLLAYQAESLFLIINLQAYSSLAPIVHIVNVGNAARESYANVTVSSY